MTIPISNVSASILKIHLAQAFQDLTEVANDAPIANIKYYSEVAEVSLLASQLTLAAKLYVDGDTPQAHATLKLVNNQLTQMLIE